MLKLHQASATGRLNLGDLVEASGFYQATKTDDGTITLELVQVQTATGKRAADTDTDTPEE